MYENIDLDGIETDKDEKPDYKPLIASSDPGGPVDTSFRMRYLATLETEERSRYEEFAKVADSEGMKNIARVFRDILADEKNHQSKLKQTDQTITNLRTSVDREKEKINTMKSILDVLDKDKERPLVNQLNHMISEENGHVNKLNAALEKVEGEMAKLERDTREKKKNKVCTFGVCVRNPVIEKMEGDINESDI